MMANRVFQLTDAHLFVDAETEFCGVRPYEGFVRIWNAVAAQLTDGDIVVISGDLAQDEKLETYKVLRELLADHLQQCRLIPGNHDNREAMHEVFPEIIQSNGSHICFCSTLGAWQILGLDSRVDGSVYGRIEADQVTWLSAQLDTACSENALLFLHHHPIDIGSPWMDAIGLTERGALFDYLQKRPAAIKLICNGHIHQEFEGNIGNIAVLGTPSTAFQFRPKQDKAEYDDLAAGYRVMILEGAGWRSEVVRVL